MESAIVGYLKDFLLICVYPIIAFLGKKVINRAENMEKEHHQLHTRVSVAEANLKNINDDIREIKQSIDNLPARIKSDIKDIINSSKK